MSASTGDSCTFSEVKKTKINYYQKSWVLLYLSMLVFFVIYTYIILRTKSNLMIVSVMTFIFFLFVWSDNISLQMFKLSGDSLLFCKKIISMNRSLLERLRQDVHNTLEQDIVSIFKKRNIEVEKITVLKGATKYIIEVKRDG